MIGTVHGTERSPTTALGISEPNRRESPSNIRLAEGKHKRPPIENRGLLAKPASKTGLAGENHRPPPIENRGLLANPAMPGSPASAWQRDPRRSASSVGTRGVPSGGPAREHGNEASSGGRDERELSRIGGPA